MIYGLVMFPNIPNFIDLTAICLFMDQNPVPTLLADTYYAIHSRYGKKGSVGGYIEQVITRCGSFDNVPLIGTKGVINYNPRLALRQLVFALKDKPLDKEIFESVCFEKGTDPKGLEKARSAWNNIHTDDRTTLGGMNAISKQAYTEWVKERVKERLLPFPKVSPLYEQPPEILTATVPAEEYNQVHVENIRLREKREDAKIKYFLVDQRRAELAYEVKMLKGGSSRVQKRARAERGERATTVRVEDHQRVIEEAVKEAE
ncbi:uncharacterized protein LOC131597226 [Vicia villosa]|uniref:uncharacterized protein LOC131597226 n=1 Tax=Vicia villosa TaxID=3911 RepID=UPI00273C9841|nr:uncharacterized protein LOC131597226 [Vicia villosa]